MCYNCLSILNGVANEGTISKLKNYFISLTPNNRDLITVSKIASTLKISNEEAVEIILKCEDAGILQRHFGIRCPKCGMLIKELSEPVLNARYFDVCYSCDEEICIDEDAIVILFRLIKVEIPFEAGQQSGQSVSTQASIVAREDSLKVFQIICESFLKNSEQKMRMKEYDERIVKIHKKAVEIASRNRKINITINVICIAIALFVIFMVYKRFGFEKLSLFVSFAAFVIPFGCNYIVKELFLTDVVKIEEKISV